MPRREIRLSGPLDLRRTLAPIREEGPVARLSADEAWVVAHTPAGPGSMCLERSGERLTAEAWGPGADTLLALLPGLIGEHDDPTALVPHHPVVRDAARRFRGLRLPAAGLVHECLVATILAQRVTGLEAARGQRALRARFGTQAPGPGGLRLLPSPGELAGMSYAELHPCGIERSRARALIAAARETPRVQDALVAGEDWRARLGSVRGIGPWTIAKVAAGAAGDPDAVPVGDYNLPHLVSWALESERRGSDERMLALLAPYAGQRGRVLRLLHAAIGAGPPRRAPRAAARDFSRH